MCWVALYSVLHRVHFIGWSISYLFSLSEFKCNVCGCLKISIIYFRSLSLIVFVPVLTFSSRYNVSDNSSINGTIHTQEKLNMAGFILITVIQTLTVKF